MNSTTAEPAQKRMPAELARSAPGTVNSAFAAMRRFASPRFYVCVAILLISAFGMQSLAEVLGSHFRKMPLPLRKPLHALDVSKLGPEYQLHDKQPPPLPKEERENLGTEEYLNWMLVDPTKPHSDPTRIARVFVTYFTGRPDMVPHNPRECWQAGGHSLVAVDELTVPLELPDRRSFKIDVEALEFEEPVRGGSLGALPRRQTVLFFFWANGKFVTTRNGVRFAVLNLRHRYAFYTKVEVSFMDGSGAIFPDRETAKKAAAPLLRKLMPILMNEHYQDWDAILDGKPPVAPAD